MAGNSPVRYPHRNVSPLRGFGDGFGALSGRPSALHNEDDFDYAIELSPDDEYRQAAEALPAIVGFDEIEIDTDDLLNQSDKDEGEDSPADTEEVDLEANIPFSSWTQGRASTLAAHAPADPHGKAQAHAHPRRVSRASLVTKNEYRARMSVLVKDRSSVEQKERMSSMGCHVDPKRALDRLLVKMSAGVMVRRHQAHKQSEAVRLHSPNGCQEILWEEAFAYLQQENANIIRTKADTGVFGLCYAICGCFDSQESSKLAEGRRGCLTNLGFQRSGRFQDLDILAVHPAGEEDPTSSGHYGTHALRESKDAFNPAWTFSIVIEDQRASGGYRTLDLECDDADTAATLLHGFDALLASKPVGIKKKGIWELAKSVFSSKEQAQAADLFAPNNNVEFMRAWRVGAGLGLGLMSPSKPAHDQGKSKGLVPVAQFLGWRSAGTQIWARLKMAGLDVKAVFSWDLNRVILKIRCPKWRLEQMAEQMKLKLKTKDGYLKPFRVSRRDTFIPFSGASIFRSSERQQIIDYILCSKLVDNGADLDCHTELGKQIVQRFPLHMYYRLEEIRHTWVTFWKQEAPFCVAVPWSPFSVPYAVTCSNIMGSVAFVCKGLLNQPLDAIAEYFGETIAFYFAFHSFYTRWLIFPAFLGVIVFIIQIATGKMDHWICGPYAVMVMIWMAFLLAFWRQKQSSLAYKWGALDYEIEETERPQFVGTYVYDDTTGEVRKVYPMYKRFLRYMLSIPVILTAIAVILLIMTTVFYTQDKLYSDYTHEHPMNLTPSFPLMQVAEWNASYLPQPLTDGPHAFSADAGNSTVSISLAQFRHPEFWSVTFFYPCLYGILCSILTQLFERLAVWLNEFENHRTQTTFLNRLILKVFCFQFVTIFTSLYWYLFCTEDHQKAYTRVASSIFSLMTVGVWWTALMDIYFPKLYHALLLYRMKANLATTNASIYAALDKTDPEHLSKRQHFYEQGKSACWEEALQVKYNNFSDYTALVIQLSFIVFFSAVFPLIPLIALCNNIIWMRLQAYKLCYTRQRPIACKSASIGIWKDVLQLIAMGGVLTNCALFAFVSNTIALPIGVKATVLFIYEQVILLFKYFLHTQLPAVPLSVQRAVIREHKSISRKSILKAAERMKRMRKNSSLGMLGGAGGAGGAGGGHSGGRGGGHMEGIGYNGHRASSISPFKHHMDVSPKDKRGSYHAQMSEDDDENGQEGGQEEDSLLPPSEDSYMSPPPYDMSPVMTPTHTRVSFEPMEAAYQQYEDYEYEEQSEDGYLSGLPDEEEKQQQDEYEHEHAIWDDPFQEETMHPPPQSPQMQPRRVSNLSPPHHMPAPMPAAAPAPAPAQRRWPWAKKPAAKHGLDLDLLGNRKVPAAQTLRAAAPIDAAPKVTRGAAGDATMGKLTRSPTMRVQSPPPTQQWPRKDQQQPSPAQRRPIEHAVGATATAATAPKTAQSTPPAKHVIKNQQQRQQQPQPRQQAAKPSPWASPPRELPRPHEYMPMPAGPAAHSTRHLFPPPARSPFSCIHDSPQFLPSGGTGGAGEEENNQRLANRSTPVRVSSASPKPTGSQSKSARRRSGTMAVVQHQQMQVAGANPFSFAAYRPQRLDFEVL